MTFKQLEALYWIARLGGFAQAANQLHTSQSAVSKRVHELEALFDTAKYPGKRALQKSPFVNLEWALMADGVAPEDVYKVLGTEEGVTRAFKKLDTIKKDVVWWESGAQGPQLLADGQVVFATSWNGRFYS
eukprot:gene9574-12141_t